jgi:hypothetical protein
MIETSQKPLRPREAIKHTIEVNKPDVWKATVERDDVKKFLNSRPKRDDVKKFFKKMPAAIAYNYMLKNRCHWIIRYIILGRADVLECRN